MSLTLDKVKEIGKGRNFLLNKSDYVFQRVSYRNSEFVVYEIMSKAKPFYTIADDDKYEEQWRHSAVIRVTKIPDNENQIKELFDLSEMRINIKTKECPDILTFYDQGLTQYGNEIYHLIRYDDPIRTFDHFINVEHRAVEIDPLDCFRLIRGVLSAFVYLEDNDYILTQFDEKNLYVGSFSEDRGCFFKIMFKGHKNKDLILTTIKRRYQFSPPETESLDIYKSYSFSAGLMVLYSIYVTNGKLGLFPTNIYEDQKHIKDYINEGATLLYKDNSDTEKKLLFINLFFDILEPDLKKRKTAKDLLSYTYFKEYEKLDYDEYLKEIEENEKAKQKGRDTEESSS